MKSTYKTWIYLLLFGVLSMTATLLLTSNNDEPDLLDRHQLSGLSLSSMVSELENRLDESDGFAASINGEALTLSDSRESIVIDLPDHLFYLSMAPYIDRTHPCAIHNLVTCRGELKNETFMIQVIDQETNQVIFDEEMTSASNGFIGLWLPKGKTFRLLVSYEGYSGQTTVETYSSSPTCLTTLKLT